jgi:hypothetical protein
MLFVEMTLKLLQRYLIALASARSYYAGFLVTAL